MCKTIELVNKRNGCLVNGMVVFFLLLFAVCTPRAEYCFGGVCAAASTILVVAIAKFGSYDKNRDKKQQSAAIHVLANAW